MVASARGRTSRVGARQGDELGGETGNRLYVRPTAIACGSRRQGPDRTLPEARSLASKCHLGYTAPAQNDSSDTFRVSEFGRTAVHQHWWTRSSSRSGETDDRWNSNFDCGHRCLLLGVVQPRCIRASRLCGARSLVLGCRRRGRSDRRDRYRPGGSRSTIWHRAGCFSHDNETRVALARCASLRHTCGHRRLQHDVRLCDRASDTVTHLEPRSRRIGWRSHNSNRRLSPWRLWRDANRPATEAWESFAAGDFGSRGAGRGPSRVPHHPRTRTVAAGSALKAILGQCRPIVPGVNRDGCMLVM